MQCMKFLRSNLQKLTQNFNNISSILTNPKIFKKIPKPRFQKHECMKCKRIEAYHVKKSLVKLEETSQFEGEKRVFGREINNQSREISRK